MPDFTRRATEDEWMDDLKVSGPDLDQALRELDTINALLGGNGVTLDGVDELLENKPEASNIHLADLGCGSGDMLRRIKKRLDRKKQKVTLTGIDANASAISFAAAHTPRSSGILFEAVNIFSPEFQRRRFDIVTASLFFHHFTSQQLIGFFTKLKDQVSIGFVINDIHRHWFSYYSIKSLTTLFSRSAMVRNDGPLSVLRAFTREELTDILRRAGIVEFRIRWRWAFRWQVVAFLQPKGENLSRDAG